MDRVIIYPGAIPLETDLLQAQKNDMIGLSKLAEIVLGTGQTLISGLTCSPTAPASMQVNVGPGQVYAPANIDATAYSSLAADATHNILKQGISLDTIALNCPAPATSGFSINYLVQVGYLDTDTTSVVLPYYNASNPSVAYTGPNNSGTAQNTARKGVCSVLAKAGIAATTGTQQTPAPDSGYVGAWVVTVAYGQTTIAAGSISQYSGAPFIPGNLLSMIQNGSAAYAADTGAANAYAIALSPALGSNITGMSIRFKATNANTGASTLNVNGLGAVSIRKNVDDALVAGDIHAGQLVEVIYDGTNFQMVNNGQSVDLGQFTKSAAASGWMERPDGMIEQWGQVTITTGNAFQTVTLPIPFPNNIFNVVGSSCSLNSYGGANIVSTSQIQVFANNSGAGVFWRAIGN